MPIYGFECTACGHSFDRLQKLSDPDPDTCTACGAASIKRQLTAPSFRLAGSGWYETDFKKDGDKKKNLVEGSSGSDTADKQAKSEPSTPAAKPDAAPAGAKPAETKPAAKPDAPKPAKAPGASAAT